MTVELETSMDDGPMIDIENEALSEYASVLRKRLGLSTKDYRIQTTTYKEVWDQVGTNGIGSYGMGP
jgi:hypothetical protein